jgi:catechol 2,3-dioxygenase-like lactoylglutathione lyase family enzyme
MRVRFQTAGLLPPVRPAYRRLMVHIGAIVLNVSDTGRAGAFWSQALGYQRGGNPDFLLPSEGGGPRLHLDETDRTHLDLWAANQNEQLAEVERLQALGATRVEWDYPEDADFVVLADPDGNLFCVINAGD